MRKAFFTGLLMLLPFALTVILTGFVIDFLAIPFQDLMESLLRSRGFSKQSFFIFSGEQVLYPISKLLALIDLVLIILIIGFLGRLVIINPLLHAGDQLIHQIPVVNKIYKAFKEMVHTLFNSSSNSFSQVVMAPFPRTSVYSLGLIPRGSEGEDELVSVFIPGTPNPTGGFLLKFKRQELIFTDMKVDDALKFIVSCGVLPAGPSTPIGQEDESPVS